MDPLLHFLCDDLGLEPFDIVQKRENIISKRIAEAFFLYAFIEVGQRFQIDVIIPRTLGEHSKFKKT